MRVNRRQSVTKVALARAVYAIVGVVSLMMLATSIWTYYSISQILSITLERRDTAFIKGVTLAVSDALIAHDYVEIETKLQQAMLNQNVLSILVADTKGDAMVYLRRPNANSEPLLIFDEPQVTPPNIALGEIKKIKQEEGAEVWSQIFLGRPVGWVRMTVSTEIADQILSTLRRNIVLSVAGLFLLVIAVITIFMRHFFKGIHQQELALIDANQTLDEVAHIDTLTGLPNRLGLNERILQATQRCLEQGGIFAVCFLDLDGFKEVNDLRGHQVGDLLLIEVAKRLRAIVREEDSVVRLGGDEFVLLLSGLVTQETAKYLLKRIIEGLSENYLLEGYQVNISASLGVTFYPFDNSSPEGLLEHADQAMYSAKKNGKNQWHFYQGSQKDLFEQ